MRNNMHKHYRVPDSKAHNYFQTFRWMLLLFNKSRAKDTYSWGNCLLLAKLRGFQFSSFAQSCPTLCNPMDWGTPGFPVHHQLWDPTQTHVHWVGDAIQPFHPLSSPSHPTFNLSQNQGLFQSVISSSQVAKLLEFQLQHQSFQWLFRTILGWTGWISLKSKRL